MGRSKSSLIDVLYARVKPRNKAKLLRYVKGMKSAQKKGASVSSVVDKLIERHVYDGSRED